MPWPSNPNMATFDLKTKLQDPSALPGGEGSFCILCPRNCGARRDDRAGEGFCRSPRTLRVARAAAHFGEEPCISGTDGKGSGAIFFTGCNLGCVYCQNSAISRGAGGKELTVSEFRTLLLRLQDKGVHNINLVTPSHYSTLIAEALSGIRLDIPVVWNSSGYESVSQLKELSGLVQIYMPDFKYADPELAAAFSFAPDYPRVALSAIKEMFRQTGPFVLDEKGLLRRGVLVRHLILPGHPENTLRVMDTLEDRLPYRQMLFSLMAQYTPIAALTDTPAFRAHPELKRCVSPEEYERVMDYLDFSSIEEGYIQELSASGEEAIPAFDGTGLEGL